MKLVERKREKLSVPFIHNVQRTHNYSQYHNISLYTCVISQSIATAVQSLAPQS